MDTRTSPIRLRITQLREVLAQRGVHALLVPSSDPHLSEYLPEHWQGRQWLSGFTGSMATLIVAADRAALFADSRYWVQAEAELQGTGIDLVKIATGTSPEHLDWLARHTPAGAVVAVDGQVLAMAYRKGRFFNASFDKASIHNERMSVRLKLSTASANGPAAGRELAVVQIAGLVARRIKCDLKPDQFVGRGERFGIIRFGSRVDVYLPPGTEIVAKAGQHVTAGKTVLATFS